MSPADLKAKCIALQAENERLEARVIMLEDALYGGEPEYPRGWKLTRQEARFLSVLLTRPGVATREMFYASLYQQRDDTPDPKIIDVLIHYLRRKLAPFGLEIETVWGRGYRIVDQAAAKSLAFGAERAKGEASLAWFAGGISRDLLVKRMEKAHTQDSGA